MAVEIINCEQGTDEWFAHRAGIPTASMFQVILASGKSPGSPSVGRARYLRTLAGQIITGQVIEGYTNSHMDRGNQQEDAIRNQYAFEQGVEVERIGFVKNGRAGYSPDSFVGTNGLFEAKSKIPELMIEALFADEFPQEHRWQCQGGLWVAEREWIDISLGWRPDDVPMDRQLPILTKRAYRDEAFILQIKMAVDKFNTELAEMVEKIRRWGLAP